MFMDYFGGKALRDIAARVALREAAMSYVDDWGSTPADVQQVLQETCQYPVCRHMRYRHGRTMVVRAANLRVVGYDPGACTVCGCPVFRTDAPLAVDDVLDAVSALAGDVTLAQFGIAAACDGIVARWSGGISTDQVPCMLAGGHEGNHAS